VKLNIIFTQINKLNNRDENLFEKKLPEFENAPWKVTFSSDLKVAISSMPVTIRKKLLQTMLNLAHGEWPKFELKSNSVPTEYAKIVRVYRILQYRLIWSIDVHIRKTPSPQQYLRMWGITTDAELPREIRKVLNGGMKLYSAAQKLIGLPAAHVSPLRSPITMHLYGISHSATAEASGRTRLPTATRRGRRCR